MTPSAAVPLPDADWMARVARRKLSGGLTAGTRDNLSLHKWLLIRNTLLSSSAPAAASSSSSAEAVLLPTATATTPPFEYSSSPAEQEVFVWPDVDIFDFPSPDSAVDGGVADEAAWLDALLDELDDEDVDDDDVSDFDVVLDVDSEDDGGVTRHLVSASSAVAPPQLVTPPPPATLALLPVCSLSESASPHCLALSSSPPSSPSSVLSECTCTTPPPTPSSSPRTPSLLDDLPFGEYDSAVDDSSDDESEGPETPLALSQLQPNAAGSVAEPTVILPESDSYFGFPPSITTRSPLSSEFPLQEC